ncbi:MAG: WhiB family transcriptional regulator [Acidimicrobiales bacterium]
MPVTEVMSGSADGCGRSPRRYRSAVGLDLAWMDLANCLGCDPDLFFPELGEPSAAAKAVCGGCVVRRECLEFALVTGQKHGIWGGTSERERRRLRRARARRARHPRATA